MRRARPPPPPAAYADTETENVPAVSKTAPAVELALELPRNVENAADDPRLANPLARFERMSTGWMGVSYEGRPGTVGGRHGGRMARREGPHARVARATDSAAFADSSLPPPLQVILEYEGVVVPDVSALHDAAWVTVAAAEGRPPPPRWALRRADGMKDGQAVAEALCWARAPAEVRRLAAAKSAALAGLEAARAAPRASAGAARFLHTLASHDVPVALATAASAERVLPTLKAEGLAPSLAAIITADDVARGRPDPEAYLLAAAALGRPPTRCVLIGASNSAVEAAREAGMACVAVAGGAAPRYELAAADLVVPGLEGITMADLKSLFRYEEQVSPFSESEDFEEARASADSDDDEYGGASGPPWGRDSFDDGGGLF